MTPHSLTNTAQNAAASGTVTVSPTNVDVSQTIVVAQNQSLSAAVDLGAFGLLGFVCPAAIEATTTRLSIQAASTAGGTYNTVYVDGVKFFLTFAVNDYALIGANLPEIFFGLRFIKITMETAAGVAVVQATAARTFTIIKRPL